GKKNKTPAPGAGSDDLAASAGPAAAEPGADGPVLTLPEHTGTPPNRTTAPLDAAAVARLVALEFPGFKKDVHSEHPLGLDIRHKTEARPLIQVSITARPCGDCP